MSVATYTKTGTKASVTAKLDKEVFGVEVTNYELLKRAYVGYLANGRENLAVAKTRGLIRGGGRKPWRQKGTGRARFGSIRNPIWRGGGIVFGPTGEENYKIKLPTRSKQLAIKQALSLAAKEDRIIIIDDFEVKDGKVSSAKKLLDKISATRNVLIVTEKKSDLLVRATNNLQDVTVVDARYLNVYSVVNADSIVITKNGLSAIQDWIGTKKAEK